MAVVLKYLYNTIDYYFTEYNDPRMENFFLLGSPFPVLGILIFYLYFVNSIGPKLMENRKPFNLERIMQIYNLIQIIVNLYIGIFGAYNSYCQKDFNFRCQPLTHIDTVPMNRLIFVTYVYYIMKLVDLLDTVFFVLRKKYTQITFLHLYHHAIMIVGVYLFTKFMAGSHGTMLGIINSFVHVIMYSYYLLTSFKNELKSSLWWKKYITQIQLIQFAYLIIHFAMPIFIKGCNYPKIILFVALIQNSFMLFLFSDFYYRAYIKKKN